MNDLAPSTLPASVNIPAPPSAAQIIAARDFSEFASVLTIDSPSMLQLASDELGKVTKLRKELEDARFTMTRPLDVAKKAIMDFFRPADTFAESAEKAIKGEVARYTREQDRLRREAEQRAEQERQRLAAEVERQRREAEAEANRKRREAEAEVERQRREAEQEAQAKIEAARQEAEALIESGNVAAAEQVLERAEGNAAAIQAQAAVQAAETLDRAEEDAAALQSLAATAPAPIARIAVPAPAKAQGMSVRENWKAEVLDLDAVVNAAAAGDANARGILQVNQTALNGLARSLKAQLRIPGVRAYDEPVVAARRAA
jgi:DNA repair exonuclease SbcCD ATPase subunit